MTADELRKLDADVHHEVMGIKMEMRATGLGTTYYVDPETGCLPSVPHYSTDIAAAWQVLEYWKGDFEVTLRRQNMVAWKCELFKPSQEWQAWDATAPLAICRAALAAVRANPRASLSPAPS